MNSPIQQGYVCNNTYNRLLVQSRSRYWLCLTGC
nr:MAG TPA: hypothetical protein [Caudoviricetes sp.]